MEDIQKRKIFQRIKAMTQAQFYNTMDILHTDAYLMAEKHYLEAMEIVLQPKQRKAVIAKALEIREVWDGITIREEIYK